MLPVQEVVLHDCSRTQWYKLLNDPACAEPGEVSVKIKNTTYLSGSSDVMCDVCVCVCVCVCVQARI